MGKHTGAKIGKKFIPPVLALAAMVGLSLAALQGSAMPVSVPTPTQTAVHANPAVSPTVPAVQTTPSPTPVQSPTPSPVARQKLPLEGRVIGVNAGHQAHMDGGHEPLSPDSGSPKKKRVSSGTRGTVTKIPESEANLAIALKLRDRLEAAGARVVMVRTTQDVRLSNVERAQLANAAGVDVYLSLHCNGNHSHKASGLETLVPEERGYQTGDVLADSKRLAAIMQQEEIKATGAKDDGLSLRRDLSSFNWAKMPTCLVEMGYMTNPAEDRLLSSPDYQDKLVDGMVSALELYFGQP